MVRSQLRRRVARGLEELLQRSLRRLRGRGDKRVERAVGRATHGAAEPGGRRREMAGAHRLRRGRLPAPEEEQGRGMKTRTTLEWAHILIECGVKPITAAKWGQAFSEEFRANPLSAGDAELDDFLGQVLHESQMLEKVEE